MFDIDIFFDLFIKESVGEDDSEVWLTISATVARNCNFSSLSSCISCIVDLARSKKVVVVNVYLVWRKSFFFKEKKLVLVNVPGDETGDGSGDGSEVAR